MFYQSEALPHKVVLYVPQSRQQLLKGWSQRLAKAAGGLSERYEFGYWHSPKGELIAEPVAVLTAFYGDDKESDVWVVFNTIIGEVLAAGEEAVLYEYGGFTLTASEAKFNAAGQAIA